VRVRFRHIFFFLGLAAVTGCKLVDEDMSDCETDYTLDYELRLVTNMTAELQTRLSLAADVKVATALQSYLNGIFTDFAHDVDLNFYDVVEDEASGDSLRLHHEAHVMDANQSSYTLYIPVHRYMHLAVANIEDNGVVSLENGNLCHGASLTQGIQDTLPCQKTGLFSARLPMDIKEGEDQEFNVRLFMANCASALVVDTQDCPIRDMRVFADGFATDFSLCDSVYHFRHSPKIRADRVEVKDSPALCFATVNFPSRDVEPTKTVIQIDNPDVEETSEGALWRYYVYVTLPDGTVTESILGVFTALPAGYLKIIKVKVLDNGAVQTSDPLVGVSVTLDWEPGQEYVVPF